MLDVRRMRLLRDLSGPLRIGAFPTAARELLPAPTWPQWRVPDRVSRLVPAQAAGWSS